MLFGRFFFNDTATTEIYTLSLHDALPISELRRDLLLRRQPVRGGRAAPRRDAPAPRRRPRRHPRRPRRGEPRRLRSEEHTSELQSRQYLVCRLLLEKKKQSYHVIALSLIR